MTGGRIYPAQRPDMPTAIVQLCGRFREDWGSGGSPRVEDWLQQVEGELRSDLFRGLLEVELSLRRQREDALDPAEYKLRFPEFESEIDSQFDSLNVGPKDDSRPDTLDSTRIYRESMPLGAETPAHVPGDRIGRYRLDVLVGRGGFGEVWKAYDPELDRTVAVKLARADRTFSESSVDDMRAEARRAASLRHRSIVPVYDVERDGETLCIVSEFVDGQTLAHRLYRERVSQDEAIAIVIEIAEALHHAHTNDIVHRDVKPANILLRSDGEALLTDFGIAISEDEQLREPSARIGTWHYMSPEQARGESNRVDARSDVYSLGVVLYELLTGRLPFPSANAQEYVEQVISRAPRPLRTIDDTIDPELEQICLQCLETAVSDRCTTCRDLATALRNLDPTLAGESQQSAWEASPRPAKRKRAIAVGVVSLLVALAGVTAWSARNKETPTIESNAGFAVASTPDPVQETSIGPELPATWTQLLSTEPKIFAWRLGDGRETPEFDADLQRYSVQSDRTQWVAEVAKFDPQPFEMRAIVSVGKWVGHAGVVWGLRDDPGAFPDKPFRCLAVDFYRTGPTAPAKLAVREIVMTKYGYQDVRVTSGRVIDVREIEVPKQHEAVLEVSVQETGIRVRFDQRIDWEPVDLLDETDWLPDGRTAAVGMTGVGHDVVIRDLSIQRLP